MANAVISNLASRRPAYESQQKDTGYEYFATSAEVKRTHIYASVPPYAVMA
jgi:hypothetical protein